MSPRPSRLLPLLALLGPALHAQQPAPAATVQVTATRFPESPAKVPGSITVITGQELADRGATDLRSALALAAGVSIAPGGDAGPASSVPEFWGLREMDAFLLVVDGVPWGGAFNPALATLDLHDVERIEVQRGAAPVMYGATSFVGVIHVIHRAPADAQNALGVSAGSHSSGSGFVTFKLPKWAGFDSSLEADYTKQGFTDPRTQFNRTHLLWRNRMVLGEGSFHFDLDVASINQDPASPHLREGKKLSTNVPLDGNHNPAGAYLDENRVTLNLGYDRSVGSGLWSTLLSVSRSNQKTFRGFLADIENPEFNAHGFREKVDTTNLYFDTHIALTHSPELKTVVGFDHIHGQGTGKGGDFDYNVNLDGSNPPGGDTLPPAADIRVDDRRDFSGVYAFAEWEPVSRLVIEGGLRLNRTDESRRTYLREIETGDVDAPPTHSQASTRFSGGVGLNWTAWQSGSDWLRLFTNYRNTFKPAATDFGLDTNPEILKPETARSYEVGVKSSFLNGRLQAEADVFRMDFSNLVVSQTQGGVPALINAGQERFQGVEGELRYAFGGGLSLHGAFSYHDARFQDFAFEFDPGVPTQLRGKRLEMSPYQLGALGLVFAPALGWMGSVEANYVGGCYLNKRNTAPTGGYTTLAASLGYRTGKWTVRLAGQNLTDKRNPVAESELGDAQYYRMTGRRVDLSFTTRF